MEIKTLETKPNETAEEGFRRKAEVLDKIYEQMQRLSRMVKANPDSIIYNVVCLVEEFNHLSIEDDK